MKLNELQLKKKIARYKIFKISCKVFHWQELYSTSSPYTVQKVVNGFWKSHNTWIVRTRTCSVQFLALILFSLQLRSPGDCQIFVRAQLLVSSFIFPQKSPQQKPGPFYNGRAWLTRQKYEHSEQCMYLLLC